MLKLLFKFKMIGCCLDLDTINEGIMLILCLIVSNRCWFLINGFKAAFYVTSYERVVSYSISRGPTGSIGIPCCSVAVIASSSSHIYVSVFSLYTFILLLIINLHTMNLRTVREQDFNFCLHCLPAICIIYSCRHLACFLLGFEAVV